MLVKKMWRVRENEPAKVDLSFPPSPPLPISRSRLRKRKIKSPSNNFGHQLQKCMLALIRLRTRSANQRIRHRVQDTLSRLFPLKPQIFKSCRGEKAGGKSGQSFQPFQPSRSFPKLDVCSDVLTQPVTMLSVLNPRFDPRKLSSLVVSCVSHLNQGRKFLRRR